MTKEFNVTGTCIPERHYMANIQKKLDAIAAMVKQGKYFVINRPRQYGKTTTMFLLERMLRNDYVVIKTSFEGIGDTFFSTEEQFSSKICGLLADGICNGNSTLRERLRTLGHKATTLDEVSSIITSFVREASQRIILMIDEVDRSSNNQLFLAFLGMLRNKYLQQNEGKDYTFHSVILAGVHDIKNLKLKIRPDAEKKYNSPWNIAARFTVDMSLHADEIDSMLIEYAHDHALTFDTKTISETLYYYTNGYPFLVSRLCQIIDEEMMRDAKRAWTSNDCESAVQLLLKEANTLFDDLIKNLENNAELYRCVYEIVIKGDTLAFNIDNPLVSSSVMYGIMREQHGKVVIDNKIFEQRIYNYLSSKIELLASTREYNFRDNFILDDGTLDMEQVLLKFQLFMKEQRSKKDAAFLEREGRLLFLAFIKPIINGSGYDFKEIQISEERRLDVVITFNNARYVVELKIWRGEKAHQKGLKQLIGYIDALGLHKGYLLIYDFSEAKEYKHEHTTFDGKDVCMAWV